MRPFRWKPAFRPKGDKSGPGSYPPEPFFREARTFLELLAVAHGSSLLRLAALPHCIDWSAGRLLGWSNHSGGIHQGRAAQEFDGFELSPELSLEALAEAREAFENRMSKGYKNVAPVVGRLAEALARDGKYAAEDKVLDVAIALEWMFKPKDGKISKELQEKVAGLLGGDDEASVRIKDAVKQFYYVRSAIIHGPKDERKRRLLEEKNKAFDEGFRLARKSLFKMVRYDLPLTDVSAS